MAAKPTQAQIDSQIEALKTIKPAVRHFSRFGDNHHASIDAQIEVLENDLSEKDIDDREIFEDDPDSGEWATSVAERAREARAWLDGEFSEYSDLAASWRELVT